MSEKESTDKILPNRVVGMPGDAFLGQFLDVWKIVDFIGHLLLVIKSLPKQHTLLPIKITGSP